MRAIAADIDPALVIDVIARLDRVFSELRWQARFSSVAFTLIAIIALVLSAAGLYALMAFTVSERTREIGIRIALGAPASGIVDLVIRRALLQLGTGVVLGTVLSVIVVRDIVNESTLSLRWPLIVAGVTTVLTAAGLVACVVPTCRALRIQPNRALAGDG
jgi:putative ABC transport system permease protein